MISPTRVVPRSTMNAPAGVIREIAPPQASLPASPALPKVTMETKNKSIPITTLGWPRGFLILDTSSAKERKIKGRKKVAQEK